MGNKRKATGAGAGNGISCRWVIFLLFLAFSLRIFHLDGDVPNLQVAQYMPLDEGYYAMQAFQLLHPKEAAAVEEIDSGRWQQWNSAVSFLTTLFCTATLALFGDTYYGLRMSAVLAEAVVFAILLWLLYRQEQRRGRRPQGALLLFGLIAVCNFAFTLAGRIVEPSIFRMLAAMLMTLCFYRSCEKDKGGYWGLGAFAVLSVIWGYPTNLFVFVPCGLLLLLEALWRTGCFWKSTLQFIGGGLGAYLSGEAIMYLVQRRFFWQDFLRVVAGREAGRISFSPVALKDCAKAYLSGNFFVYGGTVLAALAIFSVFYGLVSGWRQRDRWRIFLGLFAVGHAAQSIVTNDFAWRKSIVVFPIVLLNLYLLYRDRDILQAWSRKLPVGKRRLLRGLLAVIALLESFLAWLRVSGMDDQDMGSRMRLFFLAGTALLLLGFLFWLFCDKKWRIGWTWGIIVVPMLLVNIGCSYRYIVRTGTTEKQVMLELDELVGEEFVLGGMPYAFCLYNRIIPLSSVYDAYLGEAYVERTKELLQNESVRYYLGYPMEGQIGEIFACEGWRWEEKRVFERAYRTSKQQAESGRIILYERVKD